MTNKELLIVAEIITKEIILFALLGSPILNDGYTDGVSNKPNKTHS